MDTKHILLFIAGALLALSKYVAAALPAYAPYANTVETVLAALMAFFGATSPQLHLGGGHPPSGGAGSDSGRGSVSAPQPPPKPPTAARSMLWPGRTIAVVMACVLTCPTGCAAASQWWQQFLDQPAATISSFVTYVEGFVQTAQAIWALLSPALGTNTAQANADFNSAVASLEDALSALQDGVQAAVAAQQPSPDFTTLVSAVQDAVAKVVAIIQQWQPHAAGVSVESMTATLQHQAQQIHAWRTH